MQFTSTIIALVAALAMVDPSQAGFVGKVLGAVTGGGKRSVEARGLDHWIRTVTPQLSEADKAIALKFQACMNSDAEKMIIKHLGGPNFTVNPADLSWSKDCEDSIKSYMAYLKSANIKDEKVSLSDKFATDALIHVQIAPKDQATWVQLAKTHASRKL